jgi:hypothetical protein
VVLSALTGGLLGSRVLATATDRESERSRSYAAALAVVESQYVEPLDTTPLIYGSIEGMLRTLDPHSTFSIPSRTRRCASARKGTTTDRHQHRGGRRDITVTQLFEGSPPTARGFDAATSSRSCRAPARIARAAARSKPTCRQKDNTRAA